MELVLKVSAEVLDFMVLVVEQDLLEKLVE